MVKKCGLGFRRAGGDKYGDESRTSRLCELESRAI